MFGQLERGYMIATPAYGYTLKREMDGAGNRIGSHWLINEPQAEIVRDVFERRARGESMHQIARSLNERGIPTRRSARKANGGYWRPSSIRNLLENTIYKGVFVWNGSTTVRARAKKHGHIVEPVTFLRPELRIVSEQLWERCNQKTISRSGYGGGRHALAGLVTCGCCESILAVTSKSRCRSLYCPRCTVAKSVITADERLTGTVATQGVQYLLIHAARHFLSEPFIEEFRAQLRAKLVGDIDEQLRVAKVELARLEGAQERISRLIAADESEDPVLLARYAEARERAQAQRQQVAGLAKGVAGIDREAIAAQVAVVDPVRVMDDLFESDIPASQVRAVLSRLFPSVVLERKLSTYQSVFSVRFSPGVALAMLSGTKTIEEQETELRFLLRYWPVHSFGEAKWTVERLTPEKPEASRQPIPVPALAHAGDAA
ncbi:recombinase family protein [Thauera sp. ZXT1-4]|uniref:recombinase family protein n=1 Tax=Thauera sp. ZXT1-4 TaxID=3460294 RepID=UPI004040AC19